MRKIRMGLLHDFCSYMQQILLYTENGILSHISNLILLKVYF